MHGEIQEECSQLTYMQPLPGSSKTTQVWRLDKGVNGLKEACRASNEKITTTLEQLVFKSSRSDPSSFVQGTLPDCTYLLCYVDDILIAGYKNTVNRTKHVIATKFKCDDVGAVNLFLGMKVLKDRCRMNSGLGSLIMFKKL